VAKLAQRGKGKKVRFQGGLLFPGAIIVVIVLGMVTVLYARESRPDPGSFPPQVGDHWHAAYGFYRCDTWLPKITDDKEETVIDDATGGERLADDEYALSGVHTHGDGVIHYHPFSTRSVGKRAKLGVFLDVYDIELSDTRLAFPESEGGEVYDLDDGYECGGEDTEIKVVAWDSYTDTGEGQTYITDLTGIPIKNDGMVFAIAVVPRGAEVSMPTWAANLPALGAADQANVPQTTVEGQTGTTAVATPGSDVATSDPATSDPGTTDSATSDTATTDPGSTDPETTGPETTDPGGTGETGTTTATDD
jgi:hypothetical protein